MARISKTESNMKNPRDYENFRVTCLHPKGGNWSTGNIHKADHQHARVTALWAFITKFGYAPTTIIVNRLRMAA